MTLSREAAWQLLTEWTQSESLRKHALAVEAAVRGYARQQGANEEEWAVVALLHDFDYERYPTLGDHPNKGCEHLRSLGYPEWVMRAILSHAWEITGIQPESPVEKALVACDELAGFVTAASLVRPSKSVLDLEAKSVIKRMKDKAFARQVPRDHLIRGAELMGLPLEEHVTNVIGFMRLAGRCARVAGNAVARSTPYTLLTGAMVAYRCPISHSTSPFRSRLPRRNGSPDRWSWPIT